MDNWEAERYDDILARTTALFASRGDEQIVALLIDVHNVDIGVGSNVIEVREDPWSKGPVNVYNRVALFDVDDHLVSRFTENVCLRVARVFSYVAERQGESQVTEVVARSALPEVDANWRETFAGRLDTEWVSNQARRERGISTYPVTDDLTFGSKTELLLYKVLKELQTRAAEDRTIAIAPSAGVRLRAGHTWTPDFIVIGNGRAAIFEVDGPHHRAARRFADDRNRDLQWQRCGVPTVRLPVEDFDDVNALTSRVAEELRRHLFS